MNYLRLLLAALGGTVASFAVGGLIFWLAPALIEEGHNYPAVFRKKEEMMKVMPVGMLATFLSILVAAVIFASTHPSGSVGIPGLMEGARFGVLLGAFVVFAFVLHNYVNLNIGLKLALGQAAAYFVQWTVVGIVIGLIYRPAT